MFPCMFLGGTLSVPAATVFGMSVVSVHVQGVFVKHTASFTVTFLCGGADKNEPKD